jgi:hypothetical protein
LVRELVELNLLQRVLVLNDLAGERLSDQTLVKLNVLQVEPVLHNPVRKRLLTRLLSDCSSQIPWLPLSLLFRKSESLHGILMCRTDGDFP